MSMTRRRLLDDTFKKTVEGNPAIAIDSLARMYPGITMQGWTEQAKTTGAQLFDRSLAEDNKYQNFDISSNDFSIVQNDGFWITGKIPVKPNTTYTINANAFGAYYSDADTPITTTFKEENPFVTPENANYVCLNLKKSNYPFGSDIMLNEGTTALPYEPYTGGQPSPSPDYPQEIVSSGSWDETAQKWEYEINMAGAQLFDESDIQVVSVDSEGTQRNGFEITGLKPGQYTISTKQKTIGTIGYLYANVKNSSGEYDKIQYIVTDVKINTVTISIRSGDTLIIYDAKRSNSMEVSKSIFAEYGIMLNISSTALPYQPYHTPQSITLQSDRPLTKWDRLEKRNGQWGWVYKSEEIESYTDESVPGEYFSTTGQLSVGAQVWYETDTETFVPLTTAEQEAMNALYTYRPTTVLSNQQDCDMTLTYKTRKGMN